MSQETTLPKSGSMVSFLSLTTKNCSECDRGRHWRGDTVSFREEYWPLRVPINHLRTFNALSSAVSACCICSNNCGCSACVISPRHGQKKRGGWRERNPVGTVLGETSAADDEGGGCESTDVAAKVCNRSEELGPRLLFCRRDVRERFRDIGSLYLAGHGCDAPGIVGLGADTRVVLQKEGGNDVGCCVLDFTGDGNPTPETFLVLGVSL
jgi:hypothetical protein